MKLIILLLGQARQLAGTGRLEIELADGARADEAVPAILERVDPAVATVLADDEGKLRPGVMVILRDETIDPAAPNLLVDGDELSLLPPMSGG